jgi:hypothetical protein
VDLDITVLDVTTANLECFIIAFGKSLKTDEISDFTCIG